jgi:hypothetical protein
MKHFLATFAITAASILSAQHVVYQENFDKPIEPAPKGIRECIDVTDHPVVKRALRLRTTEGGLKGTPVWTSPRFGEQVLDYGPEEVTVAYWINPITSSVRYFLFVNDLKFRQMAAVLLDGEMLTPNDAGSWINFEKLPLNTWYHIKYVFKPLDQIYDIFVNDMDKPLCKNIRYRYEDTTVPAGLWIEGSETEPSETLLGPITVSVKTPAGYDRKNWLENLNKSYNQIIQGYEDRIKNLGIHAGKLQQQLDQRKTDPGQLESPYDIILLYRKIKGFDPIIKQAETNAAYHEKLFGRNALGAAFFPVDSTIKVMDIYDAAQIATSALVEDLFLAQRETISVQAVLLTTNDKAISEVSLKVTPQDELAKKLVFKTFIQQEVTTHLKGKPSIPYPDILKPSDGNEKFDKPQTLVRFWIDIHASENVAGNGRFTVSLNQAHQFDITVTVFPFALPKEFSMSTAFCFAPSWGESFYGSKITTEIRRNIFDFILEHRLDPMNLWSGSRAFLTEDEIKYCLDKGMKNIYLPIIDAKTNQANMTKNLEVIDKNGWRNRVVLFGFDEVLFNPKQLEAMKAAFANTKEHFPDLPRLNTARIDERLFGYVDIWCPLFQHYNHDDALKRRALGEQVWWYPTDYPLAPAVNFNLDSPGMAPRVIPWLTRKLEITGILYWGLNREWATNAVEHERLTPKEREDFSVTWLTDDVKEQMAAGARWPQVPWVPYFRNIFSKTAPPSNTNGGGNLFYPGPNWTPWPSIRLKNLRDGLQDCEYIQILQELLKDKTPSKEELDALTIPDQLCKTLRDYDRLPTTLLNHKRKIAEMIIKLKQ